MSKSKDRSGLFVWQPQYKMQVVPNKKKKQLKNKCRKKVNVERR